MIRPAGSGTIAPMKISVAWLNRYLDRPADAAEITERLTIVGFPVEDQWDGPDGDTGLDVEVTSNRGDCLGHLGLARELAAATGRTLVPPSFELPGKTGPAVDTVTAVDNRDLDLCPLYTARVIQGVTVGPSPDWLVNTLETVGLRTINNVADVTNFVLHETGQPSHAFDLDRLAEQRVVIRPAEKNEPFVALDQSRHTLRPPMLVIADAATPQCLAGVMGGMESEVSETTKNVLLECATFDALNTRRSARALKLASDSSYRYERGVDAAGIDRVSRRIAALIVEVAGGVVCEGVIRQGVDDPQPLDIPLRPSRCAAVLGVDLPAEAQATHLNQLGIATRVDGDRLVATVPTFRLDLQREIDLVEEVARLHGLDRLPVSPRIEIVSRHPQPNVQAREKLAEVLVAHGYHETITFSFLPEPAAAAFCPEGAEVVRVDDDRRKAEPALRPSVIPSLLQCRKVNQDAGNHGVKLFETASVWSRRDGSIHELVRLALLADADDAGQSLRELRGTLEEATQTLRGDALTITPTTHDAYDTAGNLQLGENKNDDTIGRFGLLTAKATDYFGLQGRVVVAELELAPLIERYPPAHVTQALPKFPGIERDLSLVLDEATPWRRVEETVHATDAALLESLDFVGVYRGKQVGKGRKSVTLRMRFRDPGRTLRHEEVDPQVEAVTAKLKGALNAELRA